MSEMEEVENRIAELEQRMLRDHSEMRTLQERRRSLIGDHKTRVQEECIDLIRGGQVIQAIKLYRGQMGVGLLDAKRAVESLI